MKLFLILLIIFSALSAKASTKDRSAKIAKLSAQILILKAQPKTLYNDYRLAQLQDELSDIVTNKR